MRPCALEDNTLVLTRIGAAGAVAPSEQRNADVSPRRDAGESTGVGAV